MHLPKYSSKAIFIKIFYDLSAEYPSIFNNFEHVEETIRNFELHTFSKFSVYQKDKNFVAHGEYIYFT